MVKDRLSACCWGRRLLDGKWIKVFAKIFISRIGNDNVGVHLRVHVPIHFYIHIPIHIHINCGEVYLI